MWGRRSQWLRGHVPPKYGAEGTLNIDVSPKLLLIVCISAYGLQLLQMNDWLPLSRRPFIHSSTSFMGPLLATMTHNRIIANSILTYTAGPLNSLFHPIIHTTTKHYLRFGMYSSSNLWLPTVISIVQSSRVDFPRYLPSRSSHLPCMLGLRAWPRPWGQFSAALHGLGSHVERGPGCDVESMKIF